MFVQNFMVNHHIMVEVFQPTDSTDIAIPCHAMSKAKKNMCDGFKKVNYKITCISQEVGFDFVLLVSINKISKYHKSQKNWTDPLHIYCKGLSCSFHFLYLKQIYTKEWFYNPKTYSGYTVGHFSF